MKIKMNKIYQNRILMAALLLLMIICSGNTWGSTTTNLYTGPSGAIAQWGGEQIQDSKINDIKAGDVIQITFASYTEGAIIGFMDKSWGTVLAGTETETITGKSMSFNVNQNFVNALTASKFDGDDREVITFSNRGTSSFVISSIDIISPDENTERNNYIWPFVVGTTVVTGDYANYKSISSSMFTLAAAGNILRVNVSDITTGGQGLIQDGNWNNFTDANYGIDLTSQKYFDYAITNGMLTSMQSNGVIVKGKNYTITGVQILDSPHDITGMIPNPDFASDATNWTPSNINATYGSSAIGLVHDNDGNYTYSQTLSGLPAGYYRLKAQGFQRVATGDNGMAYNAGTETVNANLYVTVGTNTKYTPLQSIYSESSRPADIAAAQTAFTAGGYDANSITFYNSSARNSVVIGVKGTGIDANGWIALDNFRLTYYGSTATATTLSDDGTAYTPTVATGTITFSRSLSSSKWNTLCVPFDVAGSDLATVFGADVKVASLDAVTASDGNYNLVFSTKNPQIKANVPCLIKPASDVTSMTITNGITTGATAKSITVESGTNNVVMTGNYDAVTDLYTSVGTSYIISGDKFYKTVSRVATVLNPFRAYFKTNTASGAKQMSLSIDGEETTGVDGLLIENKSENFNVYNLNGQMVRSHVSSLDELNKGIYIVNGKKMIK